MWDRLRQRAQLFDGAFAWSVRRHHLGHGPDTAEINALFVSGEFFTTLGVPAVQGRVLTSGDDVPGGPAVAVISHALWKRRFGGSAAIVGTAAAIDGEPVTIVGVTPASFRGLEVGQTYDVALPLNLEPRIRHGNSELFQLRAFLLIVLLRLKPAQSLGSATAAIRAVQPEIVPPGAPRFVQEPIVLAPAAEGTSLPSAGAGGLRQRFERPLATILVVVALVLLVACMNIANLLLARAAARRHELSVRVALGASRWRLARQLLIESLVLAAAGACLGLLFARWAGGVLVAQLSTWANQVTLDLSLDWRIAAFTAAITAGTALVSGIVPALRAASSDPSAALNARGPASGAAASGLARAGASSGLVVLQVAASLVLVGAAGLLVQTFQRLATLPLGFDRDRVLVVSVDASRVAAAGDTRLPLFDRLVAAAAATPGVERAAGSMWTPLAGGGALIDAHVPGGPPEGERGVVANFVTPDWFATYGTPLREGRDFDRRDSASGQPTLVVNDAFVRRFLQGQQAIGVVVSLGPRDPGRTIVGVVGDAVFRARRMVPGAGSLVLRDAVAPTVYVPLAQSASLGPPGSTGINISVRPSGGSPASRAAAVTSALAAVEPDVVATARPLADYVRTALSQERLVAMLSGFFGVLALVLAGVGLYGVTSYGVERRRTEIGIRLALGADPGSVLRLVLSRVAWLVAIGVAAGAVAGLWASRFVATLLYGLEPRDPSTFIGAALVLAAAGIIAGWLPALRASRTDPALVLRSE
jgi:predicted permease